MLGTSSRRPVLMLPSPRFEPPGVFPRPRGARPLPLRGRVCGQLVRPYPSGALSLRARLPFLRDDEFGAEPSADPGTENEVDEPGPVRCRFAPMRSSNSMGPGDGGSGVVSGFSYLALLTPLCIPWCCW